MTIGLWFILGLTGSLIIGFYGWYLGEDTDIKDILLLFAISILGPILLCLLLLSSLIVLMKNFKIKGRKK